jgi:beta-glucuronidase
MQGLGSNFVRIGHYTQDNSFSSLADDLGVLTAVETIGWDSGASTYKDPAWIAASIAAIEEHVNNTLFNHPSIIMWAYINEGASNDPTVCPTYALMNARYKALGVNGLTTYASDKSTSDVCIQASGVDVVGFNVYPGWYTVKEATGDIQADLRDGVAMVETVLDSIASWMSVSHLTIPYFVSETGAGSLPGWVDEMGGMWTEQYAARILSASTQIAVRDARWSGIALWQFMDQRTYGLNGALSRPRSFNNKGTFDENRKPKMPLYSAVYNAYHGLPQPDWLDAVI